MTAFVVSVILGLLALFMVIWGLLVLAGRRRVSRTMDPL